MSDGMRKKGLRGNPHLLIGIVGVLSTAVLAYLGTGVHSVWPGAVALGGSALGHIPFSRLSSEKTE